MKILLIFVPVSYPQSHMSSPGGRLSLFACLRPDSSPTKDAPKEVDFIRRLAYCDHLVFYDRCRTVKVKSLGNVATGK